MTVLFNAVTLAVGTPQTSSALAPGANGIALLLEVSGGSVINGVTVSAQYTLDGSLYSDPVTVPNGPNSSLYAVSGQKVYCQLPLAAGITDVKFVITNNDTVSAPTVTVQGVGY